MDWPIILAIGGIVVTVMAIVIGWIIGKRSNAKLLAALKNELVILKGDIKQDEIHYIDIETILEKPTVRKTKLILEGLRARRELRYKESIEKLEEALILTSTDDERCFLLNVIGSSLKTIGDTRESEKTFLSLIELAEKSNLKGYLAEGYISLGYIYNILGRPDESFEMTRKGLRLANEEGDLHLKGAAFEILGLLYRPTMLDNPKKALRLHHRALKIYKEVGSKSGQAGQLGDIGLTYLHQGEYQNAFDYFTEALKIACEIEDIEEQAAQELNIGLVHYSRGEFNEALNILKEALKKNDLVVDLKNKSIIIGSIGIVYGAINKIDESLEYFKESLNISEQIGYLEGQASNYNNMGLAYFKKMHFNESFLSFKKAYELFQKMKAKNLAEQAMRGVELARTQLLNEAKQLIIRGNTSNSIAHNLEQALNQYRCAFELAVFIEEYEIQAMAVCNAAGIYVQQGEYKKALEFLKRGKELFGKAGLEDWYKVCDFNIAEVKKAMEETEAKESS